MNRSLQFNVTWPFKKWIIYRRLTENTVVFLLQYSGLMLSTLTPHPSVLWLSSGSAAAFIFLRGTNSLPGIGLGSFFAYYFASAGGILAAEFAILWTLQAWILLRLSYRYTAPTLLFSRVTVFLKSVLLIGFITAFSSFLSVLLSYHAVSFFSWLLAWLANFNGILVLSFALIAWDAYFPEFTRINYKKLGFLYGIVALFIAMLFVNNQSLFFIFALMTIIPTLFASYYFGWWGAISTVFLFGLLLTFGPNFSEKTVFFLQLVLAFETILGLTLALVKSD